MKMYKPRDFKKGCLVCQAITKSKTKKKCDFCKGELFDFKEGYNTSFHSSNNVMKWEWLFETYRG